MTIEQRRPASKALIEVCRAMLEENGIEPWPAQQENPRAVTWLMPMELMEDIEPEEGMALQMFGYPVHMEMLIGERSVYLIETVGFREVPE